MRVALAILLLLLASPRGGEADEKVFRVMPPGQRVLEEGPEGIAAVLIVESPGRQEPGRMHSDLRGSLRLELGGVVLEADASGAWTVDEENGERSALDPGTRARLLQHDFLSFALETRLPLTGLEPVDARGREWTGRTAAGVPGRLWRDGDGRVERYLIGEPDRGGLEVEFLEWTRLGDLVLPAKVRTLDGQGKRVWRMSGFREAALVVSTRQEEARWRTEEELPPAARVALAAERAFSLDARNEGMKVAFLRWLAPGATVFAPGPMPVEERFSGVPDDPAKQPDLEWSPEWILIAGSSELAAICGRWQLTPVGEEFPTDHGQYLSVWARRDGKWRVLADGGIDHPEERALTARATGREIEALAPRITMVPDADALAQQVESAFEKAAYRDGFLAALRDHADRDVIVLRPGRVVARGPEALDAPETVESLGPRVEVTGAAASAAHDFLATWGIEHFTPDGADPLRLGFLRVWQLETARWQIVADLYRLLP